MNETLVHIVINSGVWSQLSSHHTLGLFIKVDRQDVIIVVSEEFLGVISHIVIDQHCGCVIHNHFLL